MDEYTDLMHLHEVFNKWLHMDDTHHKLLDLCLAVRISIQLTGTPIWLIIVGPSGDGKSEITMTLRDEDKDTYLLHEMTPATLVSGNPDKPNEVEAMDKKLILMPDMAQILHMHPNEKAKIWAQLRELYDGRAGRKTGMETKKQDSYEGLRVTLLGCSTPAIDSQILIFNQLGTRELLFRTDPYKDKTLMDKVMENEEYEQQMREALRDSVAAFVKNKKMIPMELKEGVKDTLKRYVEYLRVMRADAEIDGYTGELRNLIYPEQPTRSLKQLKRIFVALMSLDKDYHEDTALGIIRHVIRSSVLPARMKILDFFKEDPENEHTVYSLGKYVKLGVKVLNSQLNILWNLGLLDRREEVGVDNYGNERWRKHYWKITETGMGVVI